MANGGSGIWSQGAKPEGRIDARRAPEFKGGDCVERNEEGSKVLLWLTALVSVVVAALLLTPTFANAQSGQGQGVC